MKSDILAKAPDVTIYHGVYPEHLRRSGAERVAMPKNRCFDKLSTGPGLNGLTKIVAKQLIKGESTWEGVIFTHCPCRLNASPIRFVPGPDEDRLQYQRASVCPYPGQPVIRAIEYELAETSLHGSYPSSDLTFLAELALYGQHVELPVQQFFRRSHPGQSTRGA